MFQIFSDSELKKKKKSNSMKGVTRTSKEMLQILLALLKIFQGALVAMSVSLYKTYQQN